MTGLRVISNAAVKPESVEPLRLIIELDDDGNVCVDYRGVEPDKVRSWIAQAFVALCMPTQVIEE